MSVNFRIVELLREIRKIHSELPCHEEFPVHIEINSDDNSVYLNQYVGCKLTLMLRRYHDESGMLFDLELYNLLLSYLCMIKRG